MKKNGMKDGDKQRNPRRLSLNRETILALHERTLLEAAKGGEDGTHSWPPICDIGSHPC